MYGENVCYTFIIGMQEDRTISLGLKVMGSTEKKINAHLQDNHQTYLGKCKWQALTCVIFATRKMLPYLSAISFATAFHEK